MSSKHACHEKRQSPAHQPDARSGLIGAATGHAVRLRNPWRSEQPEAGSPRSRKGRAPAVSLQPPVLPLGPEDARAGVRRTVSPDAPRTPPLTHNTTTRERSGLTGARPQATIGVRSPLRNRDPTFDGPRRRLETNVCLRRGAGIRDNATAERRCLIPQRPWVATRRIRRSYSRPDSAQLTSALTTRGSRARLCRSAYRSKRG